VLCRVRHIPALLGCKHRLVELDLSPAWVSVSCLMVFTVCPRLGPRLGPRIVLGCWRSSHDTRSILCWLQASNACVQPLSLPLPLPAPLPLQHIFFACCSPLSLSLPPPPSGIRWALPEHHQSSAPIRRSFTWAPPKALARTTLQLVQRCGT
jgi:hypothetical protein